MLGRQTSFAVEPHCANTYSISEVDAGKGEPLGTTTLRLGGGAAGSITPALRAVGGGQTSGRTLTERRASGRALTERQTSGWALTDRQTSGRALTDRQTSGRALTGRQTSGRVQATMIQL
jgi:hypothetical protein